MRLAIMLLLAATQLPAGERLFRAVLNGGQSIYRGHDLWLQITPRWYDAEPATIDMTDNRVTVPSRTYATGETVFALSSGQLPSAISPHYPPHATCSSTGNTFRLVHAGVGNCASTSIKIFTDTGTGQFYIAKLLSLTTSNRMTDLTSPEGVTIAAIIGANGSSLPMSGGKYVVSGNSSEQIRIQLVAAPDAPLGTGMFRATIEVVDQAPVLLEWPIHVKPAPSTVISRPTSFPPVPTKAKFESDMVTLAAKWCDKSTGTLLRITDGRLLFGVDQQVWYYDGAWVYRQIAAYTGDLDWLRCADNISTQYRDRYIFPSNGGLPDYRIFTDGLKASCATCDGRNRLAVFLLAARNLRDGPVATSGMRETAYLLESTINAANAHGYTELARIPETGDWGIIRRSLVRSASRLLGMMDAVRGDHYDLQQTFMIGLAMRALIQYWEYTGDPRVPVEIKAVLDYIWERLWDRSQMKLIYNVAPRGAKCDVTCRPLAQTDLINMTVPAFAWYWSITGDNTYLERGDEIFARSLASPVDYSGKVFNQNFRWGIDYVLLREGKARFRP